MVVLSRGSRLGATRASMAAKASYARGRRRSLFAVRGAVYRGPAQGGVIGRTRRLNGVVVGFFGRVGG